MARADVHHIYLLRARVASTVHARNSMPTSPLSLRWPRLSAMHSVFPPSLHAAHDGAAANVHARPWCLSPPLTPAPELLQSLGPWSRGLEKLSRQSLVASYSPTAPRLVMAWHGTGRGLWTSSKQSTGENHGGRRCIPLSGAAKVLARCATWDAPSRPTAAHVRSMRTNRSPMLDGSSTRQHLYDLLCLAASSVLSIATSR